MRRSIVACVLCLGIGFLFGYLLQPQRSMPIAETRVLKMVDTVVVREPETVVVRQLEKVVEALPTVENTSDTVYVEVPIEQRVYEGDAYKAYVSGYRANLDSIEIVEKEFAVEKIHPTVVRKPRFSVGLQAGYGVTPRGFQPYIGLGVTLNIGAF